MWNTLASVGPGARAWNQVSYDGRPILAGGATGGGRYSNDFWALESDVWREIIPHVGTQEPTSREHHSFVHCPKDGKNYFWQGHGGTSANNWATPEMYRKIWRTNGEVWEDTGALLPVSNGYKMSSGTEWCPPLDGFLTAGGGNLNWRGTYLLRHSDLQQVLLSTTGDPVGDPAYFMRFHVNNQMQWCDDIGRMALYGGQVDSGQGVTLDDLRLFHPGLLAWVDQPLINRPPSRSQAALVATPGFLYVFGGSHRDVSGGIITRLGDLWKINTDTWECEQLADGPSEYFHGGVYHDGKLYFYGGFPSAKTYTYSLDPSVIISLPSILTAEVQ